MVDQIHPDALNSLIQGKHGSPFEILGCHAMTSKTISLRALCPTASKLFVINKTTKNKIELTKIHEIGFFSTELRGSLSKWDGSQYQYEAHLIDNTIKTFHDPYAFNTSCFTDIDIYLYGEGRFRQSYEKFGAHLHKIEGIAGVNFAVWAPNAYRVSVVGSFNDWDERVHPMRQNNASGIWELFIPDIDVDEIYRYDIRSHNGGYHIQKSDPYGFYGELRPSNASVIVDLDNYEWGDEEWMEERTKQNPLNLPMSIYEVHLGSWRRKNDDSWLTYRELADELITYVKDMNYTHIELMPIAEHPLDASWGYQVTGYYAVTSRFGRPKDFMYFVDQCHQNGISVIMDWVPAHFPKDGHGLSYFDGTHLYEHADPRKGAHPDWGTYIFNYGRNEVRNFLISNALFWLKEYHIDGLRVDAVSSMLYLDFGRDDGAWIPNQYGGNENLEAVAFMKEANIVLNEECPGTVTIAEESTAWAMVSRPTYIGGLGFTLKWNMGWMHDTLEYMQKDPVHRRYHHNKLTFSMMYAFSENFVLSLSHDEVVHLKGSIMEKMSGDWWQKFAQVRLLTGYQITHPGKSLTFMGQEIAQWTEWSETRSLDWHLLKLETHKNNQTWVRDINKLYIDEPALWEHDFDPTGFQWIDANDADNSIFSYVRFADDSSDFIVIIANFTPLPRYEYRIGVPEAGIYQELLNSDSAKYGGSNVGNHDNIPSNDIASHGFEQSLSLTIPPLGLIILKITQ